MKKQSAAEIEAEMKRMKEQSKRFQDEMRRRTEDAKNKKVEELQLIFPEYSPEWLREQIQVVRRHNGMNDRMIEARAGHAVSVVDFKSELCV